MFGLNGPKGRGRLSNGDWRVGSSHLLFFLLWFWPSGSSLLASQQPLKREERGILVSEGSPRAEHEDNHPEERTMRRKGRENGVREKGEGGERLGG